MLISPHMLLLAPIALQEHHARLITFEHKMKKLNLNNIFSTCKFSIENVIISQTENFD